MAYDSTQQRLCYCNAGHNPPVLSRAAAGEPEPVRWLGPTGAAVGLLEQADFGEEAVALFPGDLLVLYTDGITEATNPAGEWYGRQRLAALVRRQQGAAAHEVLAAIRQDLQSFAAGVPAQDDVTLIVGRVLP